MNSISRLSSFLTTSHESCHGKAIAALHVFISFPHLRYGPDLSFAFFPYLVFIVITGSAVLVTLNVDPVLYPVIPVHSNNSGLPKRTYC